jgi:hypothetical protein
MRRPQFEAPDTFGGADKGGPKERNASGRSLCDGSGRRFFRRSVRDKESVGIIGFGVKIRPFPLLAVLFLVLESAFLCLDDRSGLISTKLMTLLSNSF